MKHVLDLQGEPLALAAAELRPFIEAEIERLLGFLDAIDPDPDLELNGDEADASYPEGGARLCEPHDDDELSGDENEPSLGAIEDHPNGYSDGSDYNGDGRNQERWASGNRDDREGDDGCDDLEPNVDDEDDDPA